MPEFSCAHCGQRIGAGPSLVGASMECPACKVKVVVPPIIQRTLPDPMGAQIDRPTALAVKESKIVAAFTSWALIGTVLSFGLAIVSTAIDRGMATEHFKPQWRISSLMAESLGFITGPVVIALVVGLLVATVLSLFKKSFGRSLSRTYGVAVLLLTMWGFWGLHMTEGGRSRRILKSSPAVEMARDFNVAKSNALTEHPGDSTGSPFDSLWWAYRAELKELKN